MTWINSEMQSIVDARQSPSRVWSARFGQVICDGIQAAAEYSPSNGGRWIVFDRDTREPIVTLVGGRFRVDGSGYSYQRNLSDLLDDAEAFLDAGGTL